MNALATYILWPGNVTLFLGVDFFLQDLTSRWLTPASISIKLIAVSARVEVVGLGLLLARLLNILDMQCWGLEVRFGDAMS